MVLRLDIFRNDTIRLPCLFYSHRVVAARFQRADCRGYHFLAEAGTLKRTAIMPPSGLQLVGYEVKFHHDKNKRFRIEY
jgi:hypothetical protein